MSNNRSNPPRPDKGARTNKGAETPPPASQVTPKSGDAPTSSRAARSGAARRAASASSGEQRTTGGQDSPGRARSQERIREREQQRRRQQVTTVIVIAAVVIGLIALAFILTRTTGDAPIPQTSSARYDGLSATRSEDGFPLLGDPETRVEVALYSSFDCTACATFHDNAIEGLVERVRREEIALLYVPIYGTGSVTNGRGAAAGAICLSEQDPSAFWELHDAFYSWQGQFGNQSFQDTRMRAAVEALGGDATAWYSCINSDRDDEILNTAASQARSLANYISTPTIAINGVVPLDTDGNPLLDPIALFVRIDEEVERLQRTPAESTAEATEESGVEVTPEVGVTPEATAAP